MPNIASLLKSEISRVSRKELRSETAHLKKAVAAYRSDIAALKRRTQALEQEVRKLRKGVAKATPVGSPEPSSRAIRFSAKQLATQRQRLQISAEDCGLLVGVSGQSIYNWESGKSTPRPRQLPGIAALRTLGKKEAAGRIASLKASQ
jgi:DNA-binding transcriptional regulator YiaG